MGRLAPAIPADDEPPGPLASDPDLLSPYLEDASGTPGGRAEAVARPEDAAETARTVRDLAARGVAIQPQAARSSLTGGALPRGGVVVSVERLVAVGSVRVSGAGATVRAGAGVRLSALDEALAGSGWFFPAVPTFRDAMVGGAAATNAGGPATFKYGVVRDWVRGLTVVLAGGDRLTVERGQALARPGESFHIPLSGRREARVPAPRYVLPPVKKISAGYFAADPLDLVDLLVGSEGTLGLIVEAELALAPRPADVLTALAFVRDLPCALALAADLRRAARGARAAGDPRGPDVRAIELIDGRGLAILREHGDGEARRVAIPPGAAAALTIEVELPESVTRERAAAMLAAYLNGGPRPADGPVVRLFALLDAHGALDGLDLATGELPTRARAIRDLREAVPTRVNEMLAARRRDDPGVTKVAGDLIVPVEVLPEMAEIYARGFAEAELDFAIWGHVSDGNLHPNALCVTSAEVARAVDVQLAFARACTARGGAPLSEHGVGRSTMKQRILREFLGDAAIEEMRAIKRALDPNGLFAPGVLLSAAPSA